MRTSPPEPFLLLPVACCLAARPAGALAAGFDPAESVERLGQTALGGGFTKVNLLEGWTGFANGWFFLDMAIVLLVAALLAAVTAYHPLVRRKALSLEQTEQPKIFILYAMVGALTGLVVKEQPAMGMVVFGIGGLMRFRTEVGLAKDTGRVILVTVVGVCCGSKLYVAAVLATLICWLLTWRLERQEINRVMVQGLTRDQIARSTDAYRRLFVEHGCRVLGVRKNVLKGFVTFTFRAPVTLDRDEVERHCEEAIPPEIRGAIDWDLA